MLTLTLLIPGVNNFFTEFYKEMNCIDMFLIDMVGLYQNSDKILGITSLVFKKSIV